VEAAPRDAARRGGEPGEGGTDETKRRIRKRQIEMGVSKTKKDIPSSRREEDRSTDVSHERL